MLVATMCYAPLPLLITGSSDLKDIVFVVGIMYVMRFPLVLVAVSTAYKRLGGPYELKTGLMLPGMLQMWNASNRRIRVVIMALSFDWLVFGWATTLSAAAVATILFELWPLMYVLIWVTIDRRLHRDSAAEAPIVSPISTVFMVALAGAAVALVILGEGSQSNALDINFFGLAVGLCSALVTAGLSYTEKIGGEVTFITRSSIQTWARVSSANEALISVSLSATSKFLCGLLLVLFSWQAGTVQIGVPLMLSAVTAGFLNSMGTTLLYLALHLGDDKSSTRAQGGADVTSIYYCVPVLALSWLWAFDRLDVARVDLLVAGGAGVVVVNMILHLDPEGARGRAAGATGGYGYRAIVLSLWICGVIVAFRGDWMPDVWVQSSVLEYWGIVGVCATVFVLIMSFRQGRLNERRMRMDEMMLRLQATVSELGQAGHLSDGNEVSARLRELDTERMPAGIAKHYLDIRGLIRPQLIEARRAGDARAHDLGTLMADLNVFTNLRQQGRNFAELAVMTLFAGLTVLLALFVRPEGNAVPFAGFVNDVVTMVLAAAFAFLVFDLVDKRREADAPLIQDAGEVDGDEDSEALYDWHLALPSKSDPTADRWISSLLGFAVVAVFVVILYYKWLVP